MREINSVTIQGTLTDLKLVRVGEAFPVLKGTIAGDAPEDHSPNTFYVPFQLRGPYAEAMHSRLNDGDAVHASGHLESHTWKKDGRSRTSTTLVLDVVKLLPAEMPTREPDKRGLARLAYGLNDARLSGRLVRDPATHTYQGRPVTRFTLAVKSGYGDRETTHFLEVITPAPIPPGLRRGDPALVMGAIERASWTDDTGAPVRVTRLRASLVAPLAHPKRHTQAA